MKEFTITQGGKEATFKVPTSWNEVTVKQFKELGVRAKDADTIETIITTVSSLSGIPEDTLWAFPESYLTELLECTRFISEEIKTPTVDSLILNGEEYHLKKEFNTLSIGEVKAIEELMQGGLLVNLNLLLTVFLRRQVDGDWEPVTPKLIKEQEKFDQISIGEVYGIFELFGNGVAS